MIIQALPLATSSIFEALSAHRGCFWLDSAGGGLDSAGGKLNGARGGLNGAGGLDRCPLRPTICGVANFRPTIHQIANFPPPSLTPRPTICGVADFRPFP